MGGLFGRTVGVLVVVGLSLASTAVAAPSEDPEALIHQGIELRKKGDDLRAEGYFRRAFELARTPRAAAQLGLVEMALSAYPEADQYLGDALANPDAWVRTNSQVLQQTLDRARTHLLRVQLVGLPGGATVSTAARGAVKVQPDNTIWLPPGDSTIRVEASGSRTADLKVSGAAGETRQVTVAMASEPQRADPGESAHSPVSSSESQATVTETAPQPSAQTPSSGLRWGGVGVGAAGVVAAVIGGVLLAEGNTKRDNLHSPTHAYDPGDNNYQTFQNSGIGLLIGGGVLVAGGITMFVIGRQKEHAATSSGSVSLSGGAGPGFGLLRLEGHF